MFIIHFHVWTEFKKNGVFDQVILMGNFRGWRHLLMWLRQWNSKHFIGPPSEHGLPARYEINSVLSIFFNYNFLSILSFAQILKYLDNNLIFRLLQKKIFFGVTYVRIESKKQQHCGIQWNLEGFPVYHSKKLILLIYLQKKQMVIFWKLISC